MGTKLVIFDMDGVLIDSFKAWLEAHKAGFSCFGIDVTENEFRKKYWGIPFPVVMSKFTDNKDKIREASRKVREAFMENTGKVEVFIGAAETVDKLRSMGIKTGIFSNTPKDIVTKILEEKGIMYDYISTPPDIRNKPDPEGIDRICEESGIPKDETIYVGDTDTDEEVGRNAGVRTLIVGRDIGKVGDVPEKI
ncbi:MAG: hypothetical protein DRO99_04535 [Candidatus Aenigmatarchaeota archaeon]|nr:MAG: hypothetical protein DRO99_04535 [Candidatus Aenigmarchaeota archaeon]